MTRDDIIRMALEAGFGRGFSELCRAEFLRFARLVAAAAVEAERERIDDEWQSRMQSVLEHGVKSLNKRAAEEFAQQYPELWTFSDAICARGEDK